MQRRKLCTNIRFSLLYSLCPRNICSIEWKLLLCVVPIRYMVIIIRCVIIVSVCQLHCWHIFINFWSITSDNLSSMSTGVVFDTNWGQFNIYLHSLCWWHLFFIYCRQFFCSMSTLRCWYDFNICRSHKQCNMPKMSQGHPFLNIRSCIAVFVHAMRCWQVLRCGRRNNNSNMPRL